MSSQTYAFAGVIVAVILALFGYVLSLRSAVTAVEVGHRALVEEHCKKIDRIPEIEHKLDLLGGQTEVYFKMMDKFIAATIHSPIHKERDALMEKLEEGTLTYVEACRLKELIQSMLVEETDPFKKFAASLGEARVESLAWRMKKEHLRQMPR